MNRTVPILRQRDILIASLQEELSDSELLNFQDALLDAIGELDATGVIIDLTAVEVLDSFATRLLRDLANAVRLRGASSVVVGIQPEVAISMVMLGLTLEGVQTGLDLESGLDMLATGP